MFEQFTPSTANTPFFASDNARTALILLFLAYVLSITDRMILSVLFEPIRLEFDVSDAQLGLLGGFSFAIFYATLGIPIARAADRGNRRLIVVISLALFSIMTLLCGLAVSFVMLLAMRMGVGVGEAGVNPASHSIIADYFSKDRRAFAMSILAMGANVGMIIGLVVGGLVSQHYGWRAALFVVAVPGLFLAVVMYYRLQEPERKSDVELPGSDSAQNSGVDFSPSIRQTATFVFSNAAMRQLLAASTVSGTVSYGLSTWIPSFFIRSHDLTQSQVGLLMALVFGVLGACGALFAGKMVDRLSVRGMQYGVWMIGFSQLLVVPIAALGYLVDTLYIALALFVLPAFVASFYLGPTIALVQTLSPANMRAMASAIKMLCLNLVGLSLGPYLVGAMSSYFSTTYGEESLRMALAVMTCLGIWSALHFWLCGKALARQGAAKSY